MEDELGISLVFYLLAGAVVVAQAAVTVWSAVDAAHDDGIIQPNPAGL
jgi:hypothetical protein